MLYNQNALLQSSMIASQALEQCIMREVYQNCIPQRDVFSNSCHQTNNIEKSVLELYSVKPDEFLNNIRNFSQWKKSSTSFKVMPIKKISSNQKEPVKKQRVSFVRNRKSHKSYFQDHQVSRKGRNTDLRPRKSEGSVELSRQKPKLKPIESVWKDRSKLVRLESTDSSRQSNAELVRVFRSNIQEKNQTPFQFNRFRKELSQSSASTKKLKQSSNKKSAYALNTDYNGLWLYINKNDMKRQTSHFVDMQYRVIEDNKDSEMKRQFQIRAPIAEECRIYNSSFKELKLGEENENAFSIAVQNNMKFGCNGKISTEVGTKNFIKNIKSLIKTGNMRKNIKPPKVGLNIFKQMKNTFNDNVIFDDNQNDKLRSSTERTQDQANSSKASLKSSKKCHKISEQKISKIPHVTVTSPAGLNFLLADNIRFKKKRVTIFDGDS